MLQVAATSWPLASILQQCCTFMSSPARCLTSSAPASLTVHTTRSPGETFPAKRATKEAPKWGGSGRGARWRTRANHQADDSWVNDAQSAQEGLVKGRQSERSGCGCTGEEDTLSKGSTNTKPFPAAKKTHPRLEHAASKKFQHTSFETLAGHFYDLARRYRSCCAPPAHPQLLCRTAAHLANLGEWLLLPLDPEKSPANVERDERFLFPGVGVQHDERLRLPRLRQGGLFVQIGRNVK